MKYDPVIKKMERDVVHYLSTIEGGYAVSKHIISQKTEIPEDILTVILKRLKIEGHVRLICICDDNTGIPCGSGYCTA